MKRKQKKVSDTTLVPEVDFDWDKAESVPLFKKPVDPRSGEDYWLDPSAISSAADGAMQKKKKNRRPVDRAMQAKLRQEVVNPYKQNWILYAIGAVLVLALLSQIFPQNQPIIRIPDL